MSERNSGKSTPFTQRPGRRWVGVSLRRSPYAGWHKPSQPPQPTNSLAGLPPHPKPPEGKHK